MCQVFKSSHDAKEIRPVATHAPVAAGASRGPAAAAAPASPSRGRRGVVAVFRVAASPPREGARGAPQISHLQRKPLANAPTTASASGVGGRQRQLDGFGPTSLPISWMYVVST